MSQWTDEELIARARNAAALSERNEWMDVLCRRHYERVALWCLRWSRNRDEAADLAQEIFLKVHRAADSFAGGSKFTTWLYTVCRNHCINAGMARSQKEHRELDEALSATLQSPGPNPEQEFERRSRLETARLLMNKLLSETERLVLVLHFAEGFSVPEVTRLLELTNSSGAKAFLVSAQRKLKAALEAGV